MSSILACIVIFAIGFYLGAHYGYQKVREDITQIIEKVEKVHTSKL